MIPKPLGNAEYIQTRTVMKHYRIKCSNKDVKQIKVN